MDAKDENSRNLSTSGDQTDAKTWFNFGNRSSGQSSEFGVLNIHEDSIDYDMKHKNFGKCVIFNHEFFKDNKCPQRRGSTADANSLFQCFTGMGFDVKMKNDLNCDQLFNYISNVAKEDHSDSDCFVCCILTHGHNECLWAYDEYYPLDNIISFFTGDKCKSLAGKPKIFFIQACRGMEFDDGVPMRVGTDVTDSGNVKTIRIPIFADFLIAYSSMSGYYSWRNQADGSWFISHLTDVVNKHHKQHDLLSLLTIINQRIAYQMASRSGDSQFDNKKQVPCITHTLTRRIFFTPKDNGIQVQTYL